MVNAIKAKDLLVKDKAYIVQDGEAKIVDEFSGRVLDGRRWGGGLHQSVKPSPAIQRHLSQFLAAPGRKLRNIADYCRVSYNYHSTRTLVL